MDLRLTDVIDLGKTSCYDYGSYMTYSFFGNKVDLFPFHSAVYAIKADCDNEKALFFFGYLAQLPDNQPDNANQRYIQIPKLTRTHQVYSCELPMNYLLLQAMESRLWLIRQPCSTLCQHRGFHTQFSHSALSDKCFLSEISRRKDSEKRGFRFEFFSLRWRFIYHVLVKAMQLHYDHLIMI